MFRGEMDEEGVRQERGEGMVWLVDGKRGAQYLCVVYPTAPLVTGGQCPSLHFLPCPALPCSQGVGMIRDTWKILRVCHALS